MSTPKQMQAGVPQGPVLSSKSKSKSHYDWQSVSQSVLVSYPIWGIWPEICFILF
jgi:hypothetical protein